MTPPPSDALSAIALGLLQGPAEVLPVSSSAHVELLAGLLGLRGATGMELAVALHAGSGAALLAAGGRPRRLGWAALTLLAPSAAGIAAERVVEERLGGPVATAAGLVVGSVALVLTDRRGPGGRAGRAAADATATDALLLGAAQACALWPGVSRSGAVLAAARARGFARPAAWALVRETAVPVLVAATVLKGARAAQRGTDLRAPAAGAVAAALSTAVALRAAAPVERLPVAGWAAYRCALAAAVLAARRAWRV